MPETIIEVTNISKQYKLGQIQGYKTLRESLQNIFKIHNERKKGEIIWALKNVSFKVDKGEVLGVIGRNGAGKSTLLKILTRITEPTEGEVKLRGRVASLLEVGTGFHPELTGRENIFLNGAILGMRRKEILSRFDEIVAFAEVEKFIDTPVKRFSSGMYVRLAFAVAAHLEPEILLVDEVLAVGDVGFQKKCMGKMSEVSRGGRTILFVSHNMEAIRRLCSRTILVENGKIVSDGNSEEVIYKYLSGGREKTSGVRFFPETSAPGDEFVRLRAVKLKNEDGDVSTFFNMNMPICVEIEYEILQTIHNFHLYLRVFTQDGTILFGSGDWDNDSPGEYKTSPGNYVAKCTIPGEFLNRGSYSLTIQGMIPDVKFIFVEDNILELEISELGGSGGGTSRHRPGLLRPKLKWDIFSPGATKYVSRKKKIVNIN